MSLHGYWEAKVGICLVQRGVQRVVLLSDMSHVLLRPCGRAIVHEFTCTCESLGYMAGGRESKS